MKMDSKITWIKGHSQIKVISCVFFLAQSLVRSDLELYVFVLQFFSSFLIFHSFFPSLMHFSVSFSSSLSHMVHTAGFLPKKIPHQKIFFTILSAQFFFFTFTFLLTVHYIHDLYIS